jgi:hypothetical protein
MAELQPRATRLKGASHSTALRYLSKKCLIISRAAADRRHGFARGPPSSSLITLFDNRTPTILLAASRFVGRPRLLANRLRFGTVQSCQKLLNRFGASAV